MSSWQLYLMEKSWQFRFLVFSGNQSLGSIYQQRITSFSPLLVRDFAFWLFLVHSLVANQSQFSFSWISRHILIEQFQVSCRTMQYVLHRRRLVSWLIHSYSSFVFKGQEYCFSPSRHFIVMCFDFASRYLIHWFAIFSKGISFFCIILTLIRIQTWK